MKDKIYRYSLLGIPIAVVGYFSDSIWLKAILCFTGGTICALGWMIGMEREGARTIERRKSEIERQSKKDEIREENAANVKVQHERNAGGKN